MLPWSLVTLELYHMTSIADLSAIIKGLPQLKEQLLPHLRCVTFDQEVSVDEAFQEQ